MTFPAVDRTLHADELRWGWDDQSPEHVPLVDVSIPAAETLPAFFARLRDRVHPLDIVPGLVPGIGITMPHGQPRSLKTWSILETCRAASVADAVFGLERFRVPAPLHVWYITEEDPEIEIRDRLDCLFAGRGATAFPDNFHVSIQRSIAFDDPAWQLATIRYALNNGIQLLAVDPIRASSAAVDQGPREVQPLGAFLRKFMRETGAVILVGHHDTKPQPSTPDTRAKPQRASGGGIFSIADSPIHLERLGLDSRAIVTPSHYKFSVAPDPFIVALDADDPKRPTWVRIQGAETTATDALQLAMHDKVLAYLREHPSTSGSKVATGIRAGKDPTLTALDALRGQGLADFYQRGQAKLWFAASTETTT